MNWTNDTVRLSDLKPWDHNPRQISKRAAQRLLDSWRDYGQVQMIVVGPDNEVYDGHQRLSALRAAYGDQYKVEVRRASRALTEDERKRLVVLLHAGATGQWDWDALSGWDICELASLGMDADAIKSWREDARHLSVALAAEHVASQAEIPIPEKWAVIIECQSESEQLDLLRRFTEEGLRCRALIL